MKPDNKLPLIIKLGNDIVYIPRIKKIISHFGFKLLNRILVAEEIAYCAAADVININAVAKRFAAKEALVKALGIGFGEIATFKDITVINTKNNKPSLNLSVKLTNFITKTLALNNYSIDVSLSDDTDYALATVVIIGY